MIPDLIFGAIASAVAFLVSLFPSFTLPSWLSSLPAQAAAIGDAGSGFGAWLPLSALTTVLEVVVTMLPVALAVVVVRKIVSHVTGGGGAT